MLIHHLFRGLFKLWTPAVTSWSLRPNPLLCAVWTFLSGAERHSDAPHHRVCHLPKHRHYSTKPLFFPPKFRGRSLLDPSGLENYYSQKSKVKEMLKEELADDGGGDSKKCAGNPKKPTASKKKNHCHQRIKPNHSSHHPWDEDVVF